MTITNEDVKLIEKFIDIRNKGYYCDGRQLTETYNRVLNKKATPTNCGSCIRQRVNELEVALKRFKSEIELEEKRKEEENVDSGQSSGQSKTKTRKKGIPKAT